MNLINLSLFAGVFFGILIGSLIGFTVFPPAFADKLSEDIGIKLSDVCVMMIQNNMSSPCPTYDTIMGLYSDTSDKKMSGSFEWIDGMVQRNNKHIYKHYEFYRQDNKVVNWIDPPSDTMTRIKLIEIRHMLPDYKIANSSKMILDNSTGTFYRFMGTERYVSENCMYAVISADNWIYKLADTINYLHSGCDSNSTKIQSIKQIAKQKTEFDISTSRDYQHKKWIEQIKLNCISEYSICN